MSELNMRVPVNDLKRHNQAIAADVGAAVERVLSRGWYILGPELEAFEREFAGFCGTKHAIGVANGTDALELALRALELPPGAEVATVANAGMYSTTAIRAAGCVPVYIDVDPALMIMSPESLAAGIGPNTAAVIITHLYGRMAAMHELLAIANTHQIPVIEDCAQAHGAEYAGRKAGNWGALGCFSFYPTKNLGALGDAGAVVTSDSMLASRVRALHQYGWTRRYESDTAGGRNSRMDELQAAVLRAKLPGLAGWNARRRSIAAFYTNALAGSGLCVPPVPDDGRYVAHLYVARAHDRDNLRSALNERGVGSDVHYPIPDHRQKCAAALPLRAPALDVTEQCCREVLTLPCFPEMTDTEANAVVAAALECAGAIHA